jgi:hypothetical protein
MRLRDAALAVADAAGPLPITHTDGMPVAEADKRGLRMVRLGRDLMLQLRRAGVVGTATVHSHEETTRRGTRSMVLRVTPTGAPRPFEMVASHSGISRRGALRSVTGDPYGYLAVPGGRWIELSLNHGPDRLNRELGQALAGSRAPAVWADVVGTRPEVRLHRARVKDDGTVVVTLDGAIGRTRIAVSPHGQITSIRSIDRSGNPVNADGAYSDYLTGRVAQALGSLDVLVRFRGALVEAVRTQLPTMPKDVRGFEID